MKTVDHSRHIGGVDTMNRLLLIIMFMFMAMFAWSVDNGINGHAVDMVLFGLVIVTIAGILIGDRT